MRAARGVALAAGACLSVGAALAQAGAPQRVVAVAAVSDDTDAATLDAFTRETGIRLVLDAFGSSADIAAAVKAGARYDVVTLPAEALAELAGQGKLARLDAARVPHLVGLDPAATRLSPAPAYGAPLSWSVLGLAYDPRRARERFGDAIGERGLDSWQAALRPDTLKAFSDCGAALPNAPDATLAAAALSLRLDPLARRPADLRRAMAHLLAGRANLKEVAAPSRLAAELASGDLCFAVLDSGAAAQAARRARDSGEDVEIVFVAPREGAPVALDSLAVPADAAHPAEAAAFVDHLLRPENAARASAATLYANAVKGGAPTDPDDRPVVLDAAAMARLFTPAAPDPATQAALAKDWATFKAGK